MSREGLTEDTSDVVRCPVFPRRVCPLRLCLNHAQAAKQAFLVSKNEGLTSGELLAKFGDEDFIYDYRLLGLSSFRALGIMDKCHIATGTKQDSMLDNPK